MINSQEYRVSRGVVSTIPLTGEIIDAAHLTDDEVLSRLREKVDPIEEKFRKDLFYGGIATDIEERDTDHGLHGHILAFDLHDRNRCIDLELRLHDDLKIFIGKNGSDSAGNGAKPSTRYLYLLPKCHRNFRL